jgi:hypothetical protein
LISNILFKGSAMTVDDGVSGWPFGIPYQDEKRNAAGLWWVKIHMTTL